MTIVAKNSLTVSNINDGTITHYAYAYSADGTDRFTTVYPNLNLLNGSKKYTKDNPKIVSSSSSDGVFFLNDVFVKNLKAGTYTMSGKADAPWTVHETAWDNRQGKVGLWLVSTTSGLNVNISLGATVPKTIIVPKDGDYCVRVNIYSNGTDVVTHSFWDFKLEPGSTATPLMPSSTEVINADWPSYIGQYTDFNTTASTDPTKYAPWTVFKGNDGKDGATGPQGPQGNTGPQGPAGSNGDPGKIVSDAEPTAKFKGLTWKYSGMTAINASDGTSIQPSTEYYWNGNNWVLNQINAHNINVDDLSAISATFTDGKIENNWVSGMGTGQTVIEDNRFFIDSKNSANNDLNTLALNNQQGFGMTYTNGSTGASREVYLNFQGLTFSDDSGKNYIAISSSGLNLSRDVPWTITGEFTVNPVISNFNSSNFPNVSMYKYGNIVYMHFVTTNASATVANGNIGSLPTGFIPSVQWHITLESKDGVTYRATVNPSGLITASMNIPAATDFRCTVTYPV